jgi:hypothetical protein
MMAHLGQPDIYTVCMTEATGGGQNPVAPALAPCDKYQFTDRAISMDNIARGFPPDNIRRP